MNSMMNSMTTVTTGIDHVPGRPIGAKKVAGGHPLGIGSHLTMNLMMTVTIKTGFVLHPVE